MIIFIFTFLITLNHINSTDENTGNECKIKKVLFYEKYKNDLEKIENHFDKISKKYIMVTPFEKYSRDLKSLCDKSITMGINNYFYIYNMKEFNSIDFFQYKETYPLEISKLQIKYESVIKNYLSKNKDIIKKLYKSFNFIDELFQEYSRKIISESYYVSLDEVEDYKNIFTYETRKSISIAKKIDEEINKSLFMKNVK